MYVLIPLILPVIMLITGYLLNKFPPKEINSSVGYRTQMSEKNIETWNEANKYSTKLLINFSWVIVLITITISLILGSSSLEDECLIPVLLILISIIVIVALTEKHLKKTFEE
jgi:uncharacterized membrane protein